MEQLHNFTAEAQTRCQLMSQCSAEMHEPVNIHVGEQLYLDSRCFVVLPRPSSCALTQHATMWFVNECI